MTYLLWQYLTASARRYPSRPAVACGGEVLTYQALDDASTRLANLLSADGVRPGDRVGLYMTKSVRSVVAMLGVMKAGAAYVPVDPNAPAGRAAFILNDCRVSAVIGAGARLAAVRESLLDTSDDLRTILLVPDGSEGALPATRARVRRWDELATADGEQPSAPPGVESDPAYILYTSGSTGTPKGVVLSHRNALTFVEWGGETFAVGPEDRLSNHAPLHFDLSVFDIYVALRSGGCVVMVPEEVAPFPMALARWIDTEAITVWYSVPSALVRLLLHGRLERFAYGSLRTVLFAGEVFPVKYLRAVMAALPRAEFYNLYGPTETNVCTYYRVPPLPATQTEEIPIGRVCANTHAFVVDDGGRAVPEGEVGELVIKGPSVMMGYWGQNEKTARALVPGPRATGVADRVYRTGDFVRAVEDGDYIFCGRRDDMVKSRGYRIELGEIEHVLNQHERVREAIVLAVPDEEIGTRLRAVVVPHAAGGVAPSELEQFCLGRLPKYMVPETFELWEDVPRTSTGKTDRVAVRAAVVEGGVRR